MKGRVSGGRDNFERGLGFEDGHSRRLYILIWHRLGGGGKEEKQCIPTMPGMHQLCKPKLLGKLSNGIQSFSFQASGVSPVQDRS